MSAGPFIFAMMLLLSSVCFAESWVKEDTDGAIEVYKDKAAAHATYKAEGNVELNFFEILAVISDTDRRKEWVPDLAESRIIEGSVGTKFVIHEVFDVPWPSDDRDSVVETTIVENLKQMNVLVTYKDIVHPKAPPKEGVVRMPYVRGEMYFAAVDETHSFVRFAMSLDVGGSCPKFLTERAAKKNPLANLKALVKQVEKTRGQYNDFILRHRALAQRESKQLSK